MSNDDVDVASEAGNVAGDAVPTPFDPKKRGTPEDPDPTPPMGLMIGDRVRLEKRLDVVEANQAASVKRLENEMAIYAQHRQDDIARFDREQMKPLERGVDAVAARSWFAIGISVATLIVCVGILVLLALRH